jgi:hypothetical protein
MMTPTTTASSSYEIKMLCVEIERQSVSLTQHVSASFCGQSAHCGSGHCRLPTLSDSCLVNCCPIGAEGEGPKANIRLLLHVASSLFYLGLPEIKIVMRILVANKVSFTETPLWDLSRT